MGSNANKPLLGKRGTRLDRASSGRLDRLATYAHTFGLVPHREKNVETSDLENRLAGAILAKDVGLVETYAIDLLEVGVPVFRLRWRPSAEGTPLWATANIFDFCLQAGALNCYVWFMRAGIKLKDPFAVANFDELRDDIEQSGEPLVTLDMQVDLFKAVLRPVSLTDAQRMARSRKLAEKLGLRCLPIWREMLDKYIAAEERAILAQLKPSSLDVGLPTPRGAARL